MSTGSEHWSSTTSHGGHRIRMIRATARTVSVEVITVYTAYLICSTLRNRQAARYAERCHKLSLLRRHHPGRFHAVGRYILHLKEMVRRNTKGLQSIIAYKLRGLLMRSGGKCSAVLA